MLRTTIGLLFAVALSALANSVHNSTDIVVTWLGGHDCTLEFLGKSCGAPSVKTESPAAREKATE